MTEASLYTASVNASVITTALLGDAVATNVFMLGYAWQQGWIALEEASLMSAIELNGAEVAMNKAAFAWGRQAAIDLAPVRVAAGLDKPGVVVTMPARRASLKDVLADRMKRLTGYQDERYARKYESVVLEIAAAEQQRTGTDRLTREVAVSLYKLMAYKDEYEVARLYTESGFFERIGQQFEGDYTLRFHLAPPLLSKRDAQGHLVKKSYGPWVMHAYTWLARAKGLRGTVLDIFGYTHERREERAAMGEFVDLMRQVVKDLQPEQLGTALALARLPQSVRGYGHIKVRNATGVQSQQVDLVKQLTDCQFVDLRPKFAIRRRWSNFMPLPWLRYLHSKPRTLGHAMPVSIWYHGCSGSAQIGWQPEHEPTRHAVTGTVT